MVNYSSPVKDAKDSADALIDSIELEIRSYEQEIRSIRQLDQPVFRECPLVISFVGKFKTGKSSLINALLGMDLLPTRATTATAVVTRIFRGNEMAAWLREDGQEYPISLETAREMILNCQVKDPGKPIEIILEVPIPWLGYDVELRDTPGMDDGAQDGLLEQVALNSLWDTDLCVCVYDASSMISGKERERTWQIHQRLGGNVIFAVNCANRLNSVERLNEVEQLSQSFFGALEPSPGAIPGIGKHYLMCSAPNMVDLDGFDVWLKNLVSKKRNAERTKLRHITAVHQMTAKCAEISERAKARQAQLMKEQQTLLARHTEERQRLKKAAERSGREKAERIRQSAQKATDLMLSTEGLRTLLEPCIEGDNWKDSFSENSAEIVRMFFRNRYNDVCRKWPDVYRRANGNFVDQIIDSLDFPDPYFEPIRATTGERLGGTGIGAAIGFAFGGPIGALIGGALGRAVGGADNGSTNLSISNTMSYVSQTVLPKLRTAFDDMTFRAARDAEKSAKNKAESDKTGLEKSLDQIRQLLQSLNKYIIANEK